MSITQIKGNDDLRERMDRMEHNILGQMHVVAANEGEARKPPGTVDIDDRDELEAGVLQKPTLVSSSVEQCVHNGLTFYARDFTMRIRTPKGQSSVSKLVQSKIQ